ncbi:MAG: glycosyltransferase [Nitrospinales bacterium]
MKLKILSFNWHAPYLYLLSKLGHDFIVVEPEVSPGVIKRWEVEMRPLPGNVKLVSEQWARQELDEGNIDLVLAHNVKDLLVSQEYRVPKILVYHNKLSTEIGLSGNPVDRDEYLRSLESLRRDVREVYISESKRCDWGGTGEIIPPGIDASEYGGYTGETPAILRVGNHFKERDLMLGYSASRQMAQGFPCITLGINPTIAGARLAGSFEELKDYFRRCRVYLHSTVEKYEDGYNLALLEAMATGMPVVSTHNRTSPIIDGVNGFVSHDPVYLRKSVAMLLNDPQKARELGEKARQTVIEQFGLEPFLNQWNRVIHQTILDFLEDSGVSLNSPPQPFHKKTKKNILMDFVSYPVSTAYYLERALRKSHNVITCGGMINSDVIKLWNLEKLNWPVHPQEIARSASTPIAEVIEQLPRGWSPDLYLWVETGLDHIPDDLDLLSLPKACYLIDTHLHLDRHKETARHFDFVFLAQKEYVAAFKASGCRNVYWLPLACDPEIHGKTDEEKTYDVAFVGSVTVAHTERKKLLEAIGRHFDLFMDRRFMDEMARVFSRSKIVFNHAIGNDLNMRVFEALCSGSLLITDRAPGSGLDEMFAEGEQLVLYDNENDLIEKIRWYLDHPEERDRVAGQGMRRVLERHTYDHRVKTLMTVMDEFFAREESGDGRARDKSEQYYQNVRRDILPLVPQEARCILEIGCGAGMTGRALKERPGVFVAGIERAARAAQQARQALDDVVEGNIETMALPYEENSFDCIIAADVLEHLADPLAVLKKLMRCLKPEGTVVASIPNVQFFGVVQRLIEGNWTYQKEGILDETHLRFFTYREIEKLFCAAGLDIIRVDETLDPQYESVAGVKSGSLKIGRVTIQDLSPEEMRRFFVFQYRIAAKPKIAVSFPHAMKVGDVAAAEQAP